VDPVATLASASSIPGAVTVSATLVVRLRSVNKNKSKHEVNMTPNDPRTEE
jgi:hypothetical protein